MHASWHLDLDWEVSGLGSGETTEANAGHVLGDLGILECGWVSATGGGVNLSGQWASTVLVDLVEGHGDGAIVGAGWEALGGLLASAGATRGLALSIATAEESSELTLVVAGCGCRGARAHKGGDGLGSIDWSSTGGATKSAGLASTYLPGADDGGVLLGAALWRWGVTRNTISNCCKSIYALRMPYSCELTYRRDLACSRHWRPGSG